MRGVFHRRFGTARPLRVRMLSLVATLALAGCGETTDAAVSEGSTPAPATVDPRAAVQQLQERIEDDFAAVYQQAVDAQVADAVRNLLLVPEPPARIRRQRFLFALYQSREFAPVFVQNAQLRSTVRPVLQTLGNAGSHGLNASRFVDAELRGALEAVSGYGGLLADMPVLELTRDERRAVLDLLEQIPADQLGDPQTWLMSQLLDPATTPLPELARHHASVVRAGRLAAGAMAVADVLLVDRTLDYAFEQRHFNTSTVDEEITEAQRDAMIAERMTGTFQVLVDATTDEQVQAMLDALPPTLPQYPRLMEAAARYRQIVAAGGWSEVDPGNVRRGSRGARVQALKERLSAEGYYTGAIDDVFDTPLTDAIRAYEETHQLEVDGEVDRTFWSSLNVSAQDRLAQIELTLQRWRESRIGDDPYYVFVNVPDFHAELWRNGERQMRFKVVVGNTQRVCDPQTGMLSYANATPLQSARMTYVVLNPYWNVPRRILSEELLPNLLEDETYFERNGIEQVVGDNGSVTVRQRPGPTNPLGQVKFIFPNPHDTYMHDTSRPHYFQFPVRAFSHGCMRVENPTDFLQTLLMNDGQWDEREVERTFDRGNEVGKRLNTPVPVHIEYYVVRVDDDGRTHFLSDIYRLDRDRLNPPPASELRCRAEARPTFRLELDEEGNPLVRDSEGNLIDPSAASVPSGPAESGPAAGDIGP